MHVPINFSFDIATLIMAVALIVKLGGTTTVSSRGRPGRFWWKSWAVVVASKHFLRAFRRLRHPSLALDRRHPLSCLKFIRCYSSQPLHKALTLVRQLVAGTLNH